MSPWSCHEKLLEGDLRSSSVESVHACTGHSELVEQSSRFDGRVIRCSHSGGNTKTEAAHQQRLPSDLAVRLSDPRSQIHSTPSESAPKRALQVVEQLRGDEETVAK